MLTQPELRPLVEGTPLEDHLQEAGLLVKREDLSCRAPGPPFSKMRGVISHMKKRVQEGVRVFGALDTYHSQAGHAVAYGARLLGVDCVNYFPVYKADLAAADPEAEGLVPVLNSCWVNPRAPQQRSSELGASLVGLTAGRSAVLYHQAKRDCEARGGYMMPNALKLPETLEETAAEVVRTFERASREEFAVLRSSPWLISCSSATIASGVMAGLVDAGVLEQARVILHMGYSRSQDAVYKYIEQRFMSGKRRDLGLVPSSIRSPEHVHPERIIAEFVDEGYAYKDVAKQGPTPPWPCNPYYDLKALRWWLAEGREKYGRAVLWNIG